MDVQLIYIPSSVTSIQALLGGSLDVAVPGMYKIAVQFADKTPRVEPRTVATVLEFEPVKGIDAESLTPKVIDNGIVDKLMKEGFIERAFGKSPR